MGMYQGLIGKSIIITHKPFILMRDYGTISEFDSLRELKAHVAKAKIVDPHISFSTAYEHRDGSWFPLDAVV